MALTLNGEAGRQCAGTETQGHAGKWSLWNTDCFMVLTGLAGVKEVFRSII